MVKAIAALPHSAFAIADELYRSGSSVPTGLSITQFIPRGHLMNDSLLFFVLAHGLCSGRSNDPSVATNASCIFLRFGMVSATLLLSLSLLEHHLTFTIFPDLLALDFHYMCFY